MIKLFRTADCPGCRDIQEILERLCIVHEVVTVPYDSKKQHLLPTGTKPPVVVDDDRIFEGYEAIVEHMDELEGFAELWRKYQSDACYCDEKGDLE